MDLMGFNGIYGGLMGSNGIYPLVNITITMENHGKSPFVMGKSTINGPFSIAMLVYQRVTSCKTGMIILQKYPKLVISLGQIGISLAVT